MLSSYRVQMVGNRGDKIMFRCFSKLGKTFLFGKSALKFPFFLLLFCFVLCFAFAYMCVCVCERERERERPVRSLAETARPKLGRTFHFGKAALKILGLPLRPRIPTWHLELRSKPQRLWNFVWTKFNRKIILWLFKQDLKLNTCIQQHTESRV